MPASQKARDLCLKYIFQEALAFGKPILTELSASVNKGKANEVIRRRHKRHLCAS